MIIWEATQDDIKIQFIYLKRKKEYKVKVKKDRRVEEEFFKPAKEPDGGMMDFKDLDKATKIANKLYKRIK